MFRGLFSFFCSLVVLLFCFTSGSFAEEAPLKLPEWEAGLGAGAYFFEGNEEYDPGGFYQLRGTYNYNPTYSADIYLAGMPQLNDNPGDNVVPPPADRHNWGLQWGVDGNYHFNQDAARKWDPYAGLGAGIQHFKFEIDGDKTHIFGNLGLGVAYRITQDWSARADYKLLFVGTDSEWNQIGLVSLAYNWFGGDARGEGTGKDSDSSSLDSKDLGLEIIYFDFDKSMLTASAKASLKRNAEWMRKHSDTRVILEGHCDERGTNEYNLALGERRSRAAFDYLRSLGVPADQMQPITYGEERPADQGHNEKAWAKNRRVECRGK